MGKNLTDITTKSQQNHEIIEDDEVLHPDNLKKIINVQRKLRGKIRKKIHVNYFHHTPRVTVPMPVLPESYQANLGPRFYALVKELSRQKAVICEKKLNHFTTMANLRSIIERQYLYGNATLRRQNIQFEPNALDSKEETDLDTICFAPARVDNVALKNSDNEAVLKSDLCAIVCDITKLNYPQYNQFFKLADMFCGAFTYEAKINNELTVKSSNERGSLWFILLLEDREYTFPINQERLFFYGDIEDINLFCLTRLVDYVLDDDLFSRPSADKTSRPAPLSQKSKTHILNYLQSLSDDELRKVLIIAAQTLTYFSEYNVHSYLSLQDIRINEIRLYDKKIKYDLSNLDEKQYQQCLKHIANNELESPLLLQCIKQLNQAECLMPARDLAIRFNAKKSFSELAASFFAGKKYLETRPHVNNTEDDVSKIADRMQIS